MGQSPQPEAAEDGASGCWGRKPAPRGSDACPNSTAAFPGDLQISALLQILRSRLRRGASPVSGTYRHLSWEETTKIGAAAPIAPGFQPPTPPPPPSPKMTP